MEQTSTAGPARPAASSTAELVKQLSEQVTQLARDEFRLAQLEMTRKGKRAGLGAGMFSGSGLLALYGVGCLLAAAIIGLATAVAAWLAALIVGAGLLVIAAAVPQRGQAALALPGQAAMKLLAGRQALTAPAGKQRSRGAPGNRVRAWIARYQRYQRRRGPLAVPAARKAKPISQMASTISAIHHST
jgi:hypothetical protein